MKTFGRRIAARHLSSAAPSVFRATHQPSREHATPQRLDRALCPLLSALLPFALFSSALCPLPCLPRLPCLARRRDALQLLEQLFQIRDRRVVRELLAQRLTPCRHFAPHHFDRPTRDAVGLRLVFQQVELDVELADRPQRSRQRAHFLVELFDFRGRRRRRDDGQRFANAPRCDARFMQSVDLAADKIGPHGVQLVEAFSPEPVTGS